MASEIFVNFPVKNLAKTKEFFGKLGFKFNPRFTNGDGACMVIGKNIYAMLLVEKFFKSFLPGRQICDSSTHTETLTCISLESRSAVDKMMSAAISAGGSEYREKQDYGWMYGRAFLDLDGHIWELCHMDLSKLPKEMKEKAKK